MILKSLDLVNFRNYQELHWTPHRGINVILGPNAQGKTNLLEAVFLSGMGFSFRLRDRDVVKWGSPGASLQAVYQLRNTTVGVDAKIDHEGKKKFSVNGALNNLGFTSNGLGIILFRPDDLQIIKGSPALRREFIDQDLGLIDPVYHRVLQKYRRVVTQRNNLLRLGKGHQRESYEVWNEQFYSYGAEVLSKRLKILKLFFPLVRESYRHITGANEDLDMKYLSSTTLSGALESEQIAKDFAREGKTREKEELNKRQTVFGPHRDDLVFFINQQNARHFGSQGQIRSIVLALKIAQIKLIHQEINEHPIVLLDDVLMELDEQRQSYLLKMVDNDKIQTFITTTTLGKNITKPTNRLYFISKGTIQ